MAVLTDILEWSADRPAWQRDALRRIVTQESVTDQDVEVLQRICLAMHAIADLENPPPASEPLRVEHLPRTDGITDRVQLVGLREIQGVNALAPDQQMSFMLDGMTIIFGYNGSGKSGYARVLRSLCHARHRGDPILQNAYAEGDQPTPSARVDFHVGGADRSEVWQQGQNSPAELGRVSFFDADCAVIHVDDANELAFTPFGLDILPKLVSVCQRISASIGELIREKENARPVSLVNPQAVEGTTVRELLNQLDETSDIKTFRRLANLSDNDRERINELREALGANPRARARELRNAVTRLGRLQQHTQLTEDALCAEAVEGIRIKLHNAVTKKAAARVAAEQAFGGQPLSGVGEEVWRELWVAARKYSQQHAYPDQQFPFTEDDARCVLCQQPLTPDAQNRLTTFETFIKADIQRAAERAEAELTQIVAETQRLIVGHAAIAEHLPDLPDDRQDVKRSIRRFHGVAWKVRRKILQSCTDGQWTAPCALSASPTSELDALLQQLLRRAEELERAATDEERQALIEEQNQLVARQWLGTVLGDVEVEIERKKVLAALNAAKSDTVTTGITRKSGELTDMYVTDVLRDRMTQEIKALGADYLRIELASPGGQYGQRRFKIALQGASEDIKVRDVLSEGEFRSIALAGFLAELSTEQSGSALIFDDPVSSLDHQWRRKVAYRLVQLAAGRQVIVFTHDIVFLADLVAYCKDRGVPLRQSYLYRGPDRPGECIDGVPWVAMKIRDRIGLLRNLLQAAETTFRRQGSSAYEPEARRIYGRLRETWERAVEEVLLNGVLIRFDRVIHTQKLSRLVDITDSDIQRINDGMTKSSRFLEGHDEPEAVADPVPGPGELRQDVTDLEEWVAEMRPQRR